MKREAQFTLDVTLPDAGKALHEREDGDLIIEGYASDFGVDREDEAFEPGAFQKGIKDFLAGQASLLYHHHNDQQLGKVLELESRPEGLWMKALVAKPAEGSPLTDVYQKIKRGLLRGLSVRGVFRKRDTAAGPRIAEADLAEISVTPLPVNPRTLFAVAQKAFDEPAITDEQRKAIDEWFEEQFAETDAAFDRALGAKAAPTAEQRRKYGMKDGSFPIWHCGQGAGGVGAAKSDLGRTNKPREQVMAHIRSRAKALGCPDKAKLQSEEN